MNGCSHSLSFARSAAVLHAACVLFQSAGNGEPKLRRGAFCAHPYVWRLMGISEDRLGEFEECTDVNTPGMIRISFGIYNTEEEVDKLLEMLPSLIELAKQEVDTQYSRAEPAF